MAHNHIFRPFCIIHKNSRTIRVSLQPYFTYSWKNIGLFGNSSRPAALEARIFAWNGGKTTEHPWETHGRFGYQKKNNTLPLPDIPPNKKKKRKIAAAINCCSSSPLFVIIPIFIGKYFAFCWVNNLQSILVEFNPTSVMPVLQANIHKYDKGILHLQGWMLRFLTILFLENIYCLLP